MGMEIKGIGDPKLNDSPDTSCQKYLKDNKHNSFNMVQKYAQIFVLGHYLFLEAHNFPRATL